MNTKILPYVYKGIHKQTNQFYIGFRSANKVPSIDDLGTFYFTSSNLVKELGFENFEWTIVAEFFNKEDAFNYEQSLIELYSKDPLILNLWLTKSGFISGKKSEKHKQNIGKALKNRYFSDSHRKKISIACKKRIMPKGNLSPFFGRKHSEETKEKLKIASTGRKHSEESKQKMSQNNIMKRDPYIAINGWSEESKQKFKIQMTENNPNKKPFKITNVDTNEIITIPCLKIWCNENNFKYNTLIYHKNKHGKYLNFLIEPLLL